MPSLTPEETVFAAIPVEKPQESSELSKLEANQLIRGRHRYRLYKRIGNGAFGSVWVAQCIEPDEDAPEVPPRVVAIKFFNPIAEFDTTGFIRRELSALLAMRSEFVPRVYDWTVSARLSFFVMDLYRHGSLADAFKSKFSLDDEETWLLLVDLLRALKVAHRAGILHLDIKPANIMNDGRGGYHLLDFGISQAVQVSQGPARTVGAGSRGYQAPEQWRMEMDKMDTRTDLWAVGATAWALRTGYNLAKHPEKLRKDATGKEASLPALSTECISVSEELDELIMNLLCDDPAERPGGAAEVLERLKKATGLVVVEESSSIERHDHDDVEVRPVIDSIMDPLWASLLNRADLTRHFARFQDGEYLCHEGDASYEAFLLLQGKVRIERGGKLIEFDDREGTFIGELSTLTGTPRAASVQAVGTVWTCVFNAAEFERLLAAHPAVAIRLIKLMAERLVRSK